MLYKLNGECVTFLIPEGYEIYVCVMLEGESYFELAYIVRSYSVISMGELINKII